MAKSDKKLYPSWRYHPTKRPVVVNDPGEEKALGPGWYSSSVDAASKAPASKKANGSAGSKH